MANWGSNTSTSVQADISPVIKWLLYRQSPEYKVKKGLEEFYKTGSMSPETERYLQVNNPQVYDRLKAGNISVDEVIQQFFPKEVQTPPVMTPQQVQSAGAVAPQLPEQLLAPEYKPAPAPVAFEMPQYTPKPVQTTVAPPAMDLSQPSMQQTYTQISPEMIDILTKPRSEISIPSIQDKIGVLAKLQQSGQGDLARVLSGLLPSKPTGEFGASMEYPEEYKAFLEMKRTQGEEPEPLPEGLVPTGYRGGKVTYGLPATPETTQPQFKLQRRGNDWWLYDANATTEEGAIGKKIIAVEPDPSGKLKTEVTDKNGVTSFYWIDPKNPEAPAVPIAGLSQSYPKPDKPEEPAGKGEMTAYQKLTQRKKDDYAIAALTAKTYTDVDGIEYDITNETEARKVIEAYQADMGNPEIKKLLEQFKTPAVQQPKAGAEKPWKKWLR